MNVAYWVLMGFGCLFCAGLFQLRLRQRKMTFVPVLPAIVLALVLSKVSYVILQWHFVYPRYGWNAFFQGKIGSFCFVGGAAGAVLGIVLGAFLTHQKPLKVLDTFAPAGALMVAIARFGEKYLGEIGTAQFEAPASLSFMPFALTNEWGESYPAIFMLSCLFAALVAIYGLASRREKRTGTLFLHTAFYLALPQIFCESLLAECMKWGFVRVQQILCALVLLSVMVLFCLRKKQGRFLRRWAPVGGLLLGAIGVIGVEFALDKSGLPMYVGYCAMAILLLFIAFCECMAAKEQQTT